MVRGGLAGVRSGWNVDVKLGLTNQEEPEGRWGTQLHAFRYDCRKGQVDVVESDRVRGSSSQLSGPRTILHRHERSSRRQSTNGRLTVNPLLVGHFRLFLFRSCKTLFTLIWAYVELESMCSVDSSSVLYRWGDSRSREGFEMVHPPVGPLLSVAFGNGPRPKPRRLLVDMKNIFVSVCDLSKPRYVMHRA